MPIGIIVHIFTFRCTHQLWHGIFITSCGVNLDLNKRKMLLFTHQNENTRMSSFHFHCRKNESKIQITADWISCVAYTTAKLIWSCLLWLLTSEAAKKVVGRTRNVPILTTDNKRPADAAYRNDKQSFAHLAVVGGNATMEQLEIKTLRNLLPS